LIDVLITYAPFARLQEVQEYFLKNKEIVRPKRSIIYVDASTGWQKELFRQRIPNDVDLVFDVWGNAPTCLLRILQDLKKDISSALVIDVDNLLDPDFPALEELLTEHGYDFYTIQNHDPNLARYWEGRSRVSLGEGKMRIFEYKIVGYNRSMFNVGPKQGLRFGRQALGKLSSQVIQDCLNALMKVDFRLRDFERDEAVLGAVLYYSGYRSTPWVYGSTHFQRGGEPAILSSRYAAMATASCVFGKHMRGRKYLRFYWYWLRYKLAAFYRASRL
jgi:hypothetical protein